MKVAAAINLLYLPRYASCWVGSSVDGKMVGMPGIKVLSASPPPHRDFLFRSRRAAALSGSAAKVRKIMPLL